MTPDATQTSAFLPLSWRYVLASWRRRWLDLNWGDRLFLLAFIAGGLGLLVFGSARILSLLTFRFLPIVGPSLGLYAFLIISLLWVLPLAKVRRSKLFGFVVETKARRLRRISMECVLAFTFAAILIGLVASVMGPRLAFSGVFAPILVASIGLGIVYVVQAFLGPNAVTGTRGATATELSNRAGYGSLMARNKPGAIATTSSQFMLKSQSNPFIWSLLAFTLLTGLGIAISQSSVVAALLTVGQVVLIAQISLMEPKVGNGSAIGAHSATLPLKRAWKDFVALLAPHAVLLIAALVLAGIEHDEVSLVLSAVQLVATAWLLWIFLVLGAQGPKAYTRSVVMTIVLIGIAAQVMPPLVLVVVILATAFITRDLARMSRKGPAHWPL